MNFGSTLLLVCETWWPYHHVYGKILRLNVLTLKLIYVIIIEYVFQNYLLFLCVDIETYNFFVNHKQNSSLNQIHVKYFFYVNGHQ
jgi:hypothetical protein